MVQTIPPKIAPEMLWNVEPGGGGGGEDGGGAGQGMEVGEGSLAGTRKRTRQREVGSSTTLSASLP